MRGSSFICLCNAGALGIRVTCYYGNGATCATRRRSLALVLALVLIVARLFPVHGFALESNNFLENRVPRSRFSRNFFFWRPCCNSLLLFSLVRCAAFDMKEQNEWLPLLFYSPNVPGAIQTFSSSNKVQAPLLGSCPDVFSHQLLLSAALFLSFARSAPCASSSIFTKAARKVQKQEGKENLPVAKHPQPLHMKV